MLEELARFNIPILATVASVASATIAAVSYIRSRTAAKNAKASAVVATAQAAEANRARTEIAAQLQAANAIADATKRIAEEQLDMERQRRAVKVEFELSAEGRDGGIKLNVGIRNRSIQRNVVVRRFIARSTDIPSREFTVLYSLAYASAELVPPDALSEFVLPAFALATGVPLQLAPAHTWGLAVEFQGDANKHALNSNHVEAFIAAASDLQEWMRANPQRSHGEGKGWDLDSYHHSLRL